MQVANEPRSLAEIVRCWVMYVVCYKHKEYRVKDKVTIDGVEYVRADTVSSPIKIVILQRGWIVVGRVSQDGDQVSVSSASVIRKWGTTKGIGEIALRGPTANTVLDKCGMVRAHQLEIVATIDCEEASWTAKLS